MVVGCLSVQVSAVLSVRMPVSRELSPHHQCPPKQPTCAPGLVAYARDGHSSRSIRSSSEVRLGLSPAGLYGQFPASGLQARSSAGIINELRGGFLGFC